MAPLETYIKWHRKMWNWLADIAETTGKLKHKIDFIYKYNNEIKQDFHEEFNKQFEENNEDLYDYEDYIFMPTCSCFCCEYNEQLQIEQDDEDLSSCSYCPLNWDSKSYDFPCLDKTWDDREEQYIAGGYFSLWDQARINEDIDNYINYARIIAELPLKDEVKLDEH